MGRSVLYNEPDPGEAVEAGVRPTVLAALFLGLLGAWGCSGRVQPNVLLISIDTLRADKLGAYGNPRPTSPVLDRRLAGEGVTFTQAFSQSPKTTPSHMTMFTSLYPSVHGIEMWLSTGAAPVLHPGVDTLAEQFKAAGYKTVAFTGGGHVHASRGFDQGFDIYKHGGPVHRALGWLRNHGRKEKFFMFFHTYIVHDPYVHPPEFVDRFDALYQGPLRQVVGELNAKQGAWEARARRFWGAVDPKDPATVQFVKNLYEAGIYRMDKTNLGALLDLLDELGLAENTLVVFTSDHGEAFLEHGNFLHQDLYRETLHVPLVLRLPRRIPAGVKVEAPVTLLDLMPTILDLAGLPVPQAAQGRSLVPLWSGGDLAPLPVISEWNGRANAPPLMAIREAGYTYIAEGDRELLFDTSRDPGEQHPLAGAAEDVLAARRARKAAWEAECRARSSALGPSPLTAAPDEETQRELRALGYLE